MILPREREAYQRFSEQEREELLELVRNSPLPVRETLARLGVPRSTYYRWLGQSGGPPSRPVPGKPARQAWNRLRESEAQRVLAWAHRYTDLSSRELACKLTDETGCSVSESTVYRLLKREGLIPSPPVLAAPAAAEFRHQTRRVHELWQTDLTYLLVHGWGWYYLGGVLDDFSRYLLVLRVVSDLTGPTLSDLVQAAVEVSGVAGVAVQHRPVLLSDNGSGYLSHAFNDYLRYQQLRHIYAARYHPQTVGKFERLNRTAKAKLGLVIYRSPDELERAVADFQHWYNHERYHEALGNLRPVDVYQGRGEEILHRRKQAQRRTLALRRYHNLAPGRGERMSQSHSPNLHLIPGRPVSQYR